MYAQIPRRLLYPEVPCVIHAVSLAAINNHICGSDVLLWHANFLLPKLLYCVQPTPSYNVYGIDSQPTPLAKFMRGEEIACCVDVYSYSSRCRDQAY